MDATTQALEERLLDFIQGAPAGYVRLDPDPARRYGLDAAAWSELETRFEALALELFAYQFERVPVLAAYARACGRTPDRVQRAVDVPALPVVAFRDARVAAFPPGEERCAFRTSGTTAAGAGVHALATLRLYDAALLRGFRHHVLPDTERMRMLRVVPALAEAPHSSLAYMLEKVTAVYGAPESATFVRQGKLDLRALDAALERAQHDAVPVCLLGTTLAWHEVLAFLAANSRRHELPRGSRLFDTGGDKGRRVRVTRAAFLRDVGERLGIPAHAVVSEYGMTELGSQYYTLGLVEAHRTGVLAGREPSGGTTLAADPTTPDARAWSAPAWLRPRLVDPEADGAGGVPEPGDAAVGGSAAGAPVPRPLGRLAHHDLANLGSCACVLTEDLGAPWKGTFTLHGRAPHADLRGCGLDAETWMHAPAPRATVQPSRLSQRQAADVWGGLEAAAARWRRRPLRERAEVLAAFAAHERQRGPGPWLHDLARSARWSEAGTLAAWEVTFAPVDATSLHDMLARSRIDDAELERLQASGRLPARIAHVLAGNVTPPVFALWLRGALLGAAQWFRPATREPVFATALLEDLAAFDTDLGAAAALSWWPHDDAGDGRAATDTESLTTVQAVLGAADVVTVHGADASVHAVRRQLAASGGSRRPHVVGYGSRWSAAVVGAGAYTSTTAAALARDVALFDQQGCLSPTWVFCEAAPGWERWVDTELVAAFTAAARRWPPGDLDARARAGLRAWRERMRVGEALGEVAALHVPGPGTAWAIARLSRPRPVEVPLDRHVAVIPFTDEAVLVDLARQAAGRLQGLALAVPTWSAARRRRLERALRPSRVAPVGRLQEASPAWRQDGRDPLRVLLRRARRRQHAGA